MASSQLNFTNLNLTLYAASRRRSSSSRKWGRFHCSSSYRPSSKSYKVTLLPGDGIGPEVISVAKDVLQVAGSLEGISFQLVEMPVGGVALDSMGVPLPDETLAVARESDAVLLGAIGGYKWDKNEHRLKPETGLLALRSGLGVFANLRPATVLPQASVLWRKRVTEISQDYPDIELSHMYVDNAAMQLIRDPKQFDTIVTNNIFGDILSDEASMLTGSIGMLPSASVGELGPGLFEPIHGSAPDIAGQDKANPLAAVLSVAMLLRYGLGEENAAKRIENAVLGTLDMGFRTGDIFSTGKTLVGCKRMGEEVLKIIDSQKPAAVVS
ncbi:unnamed protein product [Victoria cruziana]